MERPAPRALIEFPATKSLAARDSGGTFRGLRHGSTSLRTGFIVFPTDDDVPQDSEAEKRTFGPALHDVRPEQVGEERLTQGSDLLAAQTFRVLEKNGRAGSGERTSVGLKANPRSAVA